MFLTNKPVQIRFFRVICVLFIFLCSCKKYPEGGLVLGNPEGNIFGSYNLSEFLVNDVDSTAGFGTLFGSCMGPCISFSKDPASNAKMIRGLCVELPENSWSATSDKKQILIISHYTPGSTSYYPLVLNKDSETLWDIERLNKDWFWIKTTFNGKRYYLKLRYNH